jgi:hypothetical protein
MGVSQSGRGSQVPEHHKSNFLHEAWAATNPVTLQRVRKNLTANKKICSTESRAEADRRGAIPDFAGQVQSNSKWRRGGRSNCIRAAFNDGRDPLWVLLPPFVVLSVSPSNQRKFFRRTSGARVQHHASRFAKAQRRLRVISINLRHPAAPDGGFADHIHLISCADDSIATGKRG